MDLKDVNLTLFFTRGVGLKTWEEVGSLEREIAIYKRLTEHLNSVDFVTYGGWADRKYIGMLGNIGISPMVWHRLTPVTILHLLFKYHKIIRKTSIFKTNQLQGSEITIWLKKVFHKKLIVRCGWLCSANFEKSTNDERILSQIKTMERNAFESADIVVVTTPYIKQQVIDRYDVSSDKIFVIPNYVDIKQFSPLLIAKKNNISQWKFCFIGRLSPEKNITSLFRAIHLCKEKTNKPIHLDLYGSGPQESELKHIAEELRLNVSFHGNIPNTQLPYKLAEADLFVLPSLYEGHPKTLLEAMSCQLPCIGTDVTGIREIIKHRETGYLCNIESKSIADAIITIISDEVLRSTIGINARCYAIENFAFEKIVRMELDIIKKVAHL